jgi:hypothetical protein
VTPYRLAPPPLTTEAARAKLIVPAIALASLSGLLVLAFVLDLVLCLVAPDQFMRDLRVSLPPPAQPYVRTMFAAVCVFALLGNAFNLIAAIQMTRLRMWWLAMAGCIVAAIPLTSSACCLLTLPMSIWAIVQLVKPEIRAAFR